MQARTVFGLVVVVGAGYLYLRSREVPPAPPEPRGPQPQQWGVPGVTVLSGARLSAEQWTFLKMLRERVPASIPLTVTSGLRTYAEQAEAMLKKIAAGEPLHVVYGWTVENALMPYPTAQWPQIIEGLYARGILDPHQHTGGGAVDLRTKDLTEEQVDVLMEAVVSLGARALLEATPGPHLHVSHFPATV